MTKKKVTEMKYTELAKPERRQKGGGVQNSFQ